VHLKLLWGCQARACCVFAGEPPKDDIVLLSAVDVVRGDTIPSCCLYCTLQAYLHRLLPMSLFESQAVMTALNIAMSSEEPLGLRFAALCFAACAPEVSQEYSWELPVQTLCWVCVPMSHGSICAAVGTQCSTLPMTDESRASSMHHRYPCGIPLDTQPFVPLLVM
jgi:hypothetical protein